MPVIRKSEQQIGCAGKAGVQVVIFLRHQTVEVCCHGFPVFSLLHAEIQGQNIAGLEVFVKISLSVCQNIAERGADFLPKLAIIGSILFFSQNPGDLRHNRAGVGIVGGGDPFPLCHPVPDVSLRGAPVSKLEQPFPDIPPVPEAGQGCPEFDSFQEPLHAGVLLPQKRCAASCQILRPGNQDAAVAPAGGRHHRR